MTLGNSLLRKLMLRFSGYEVKTEGESLLLNARLGGGEERLSRGDEVLVYEYDKETGIYFVRSISTN